MDNKESEIISAVVANSELPMENIVYDEVHTTATDIPIVSHGNICYDTAHSVAAELPMENIVYDDVPTTATEENIVSLVIIFAMLRLVPWQQNYQWKIVSPKTMFAMMKIRLQLLQIL